MRIFFVITAICFVNLGFGSPLNPVKTDTPRDTMRTFMSAMDDYKKGVETSDNNLKNRINDAIRCFANPSSQLINTKSSKQSAAVFLKETLDRVILVDYDLIPESPKNERWRLKDTELIIKPIKEGERASEWLITYDTWSRAQHFYKKVSKLPYIEGSGNGALYIQPWMEQYFPPWAKNETLTLKNWQWIGIFSGFILGLLVKFITELLIKGLKQLFSHISNQWRKRIIEAIEKPSGLITGAAVWYASVVFLNIEGFIFVVFNGLIQIIFGLAAVWLVYGLVGVLASFFASLAKKTESPLDDQLVPFAEKTLKTVIVLLGILMIMQNMGINVFSVLAGLGLGGLAFALAAKDTAANLFGSIMILVDRPFKVGDWVKVEENEGSVEEIGFRSTRLRTFYSSVVTIPNSIMATVKIDNMGERDHRRTVLNLGVTYDTPPEKLEAFMEGIREIINASPVTVKGNHHIRFNGYKDSCLDILVYFFLDTKTWENELKEREQIYLAILKLAEAQKVEFAFPTQTLHLRSQHS